MSLGALLAALALLAVNGFFVAAEFSLLASRRSRIEQLAAEGDPRARQAGKALRELSLMLAAAQLGITMASFGLGAVAEPAVAAGFEVLLEGVGAPPALTRIVSFVVALALVVFLHMVVGEMAPKSWAITHPEDSALLLIRPFRGFALLLRPFIRLLNWSANATVRAVGVTPQDELAQVHAPADLLLLLEESAEHGTIGEEHVLLARALDLSQLDAQSAMVPRRDVVAVPAQAGVDEIEAVARDTGRSRMPVYEGDLDHVLGVLHVRDLLALDDDARATTTAAALARPALVVPESKPLEDCMVDMRQAHQHIAVVVDEYGGVSGIVALEDVLEELIGEFEDESDRAGSALRRRADGALLLSGTLRPDELAERAGVDLPEGDWETVAGYVIAELGRLPRVGDVVDTPSGRFEVTRMDGHRVLELAFSRPAARRGAGGPQ